MQRKRELELKNLRSFQTLVCIKKISREWHRSKFWSKNFLNGYNSQISVLVFEINSNQNLFEKYDVFIWFRTKQKFNLIFKILIKFNFFCNTSEKMANFTENASFFKLFTLIKKKFSIEPLKKCSFKIWPYKRMGHFSFSNFFKLILAEIWKNKNNGLKEW